MDLALVVLQEVEEAVLRIHERVEDHFLGQKTIVGWLRMARLTAILTCNDAVH